MVLVIRVDVCECKCEYYALVYINSLYSATRPRVCITYTPCIIIVENLLPCGQLRSVCGSLPFKLIHSPEHAGGCSGCRRSAWVPLVGARQGCVRTRFARRLPEVLAGRVVHVADAIGRTEYDTFAAVLVVPRSRVTACPGG